MQTHEPFGGNGPQDALLMTSHSGKHAGGVKTLPSLRIRCFHFDTLEVSSRRAYDLNYETFFGMG